MDAVFQVSGALEVELELARLQRLGIDVEMHEVTVGLHEEHRRAGRREQVSNRAGAARKGNHGKRLVSKSGHWRGLTNVEVGTIQEFGAPSKNIPMRSFVRAPVDGNRGKIGDAAARGAEQVFSGSLPAEAALVGAGAVAKGLMVEAVDKGVPPSNAPSTIDKKGFDHPLFETGQMRDQIDYLVSRRR